MLPYDPEISLLGICLTGNKCPQKNPQTNIRISIIHDELQASITVPGTDEWMNKMWYIRTMDYYSAIKRNETLMHDPTQMNLENIMLSEINQS